MIPSPWVAAVVALATFRVTRLVGWDHLPLLVRLRAWISGEHSTNTGSMNDRMGLTSDRARAGITYRRPFFDLLFGCPYCLSLWVGTGVYVFWLFEPRYALYAAAPLALSSATGVFSRWLDP